MLANCAEKAQEVDFYDPLTILNDLFRWKLAVLKFLILFLRPLQIFFLNLFRQTWFEKSGGKNIVF